MRLVLTLYRITLDLQASQIRLPRRLWSHVLLLDVGVQQSRCIGKLFLPNIPMRVLQNQNRALFVRESVLKRPNLVGAAVTFCSDSDMALKLPGGDDQCAVGGDDLRSD